MYIYIYIYQEKILYRTDTAKLGTRFPTANYLNKKKKGK
mgnify:CR=1 FL=1